MDAGAFDSDVRRVLEQCLAAVGPSEAGARLDLLAFVDDPSDAIVKLARATWDGEVAVLDAAEALNAVHESARAWLAQRVSDTGRAFQKRAKELFGRSVGRRLGELWWYTHIAEKNSTADRQWDQCIRLHAIRELLGRRRYRECRVVGSPIFTRMMRGLSASKQVGVTEWLVRGRSPSTLRFLAMRILGGFSMLLTVLATRTARRAPVAVAPGADSPRVLAFAWIDNWRPCGPEGRDKYHGELIERLKDEGLDPTVVMGICGRAYVPLRVIISHLRALAGIRSGGGRPTVLESELGIGEVLARYLSPASVWRAGRLAWDPGFRDALVWDDVDYWPVLRPLYWRSVLAWWPLLSLSEAAASRVTRALRPDLSIVYSFEFNFGRAFVKGAGVDGRRVVGLQHGPITNRLIYSAVSDDFEFEERRGPPVPSPAAILVDGPLARAVVQGRGEGSETVVMVGNVRLDPLWSRAGTSGDHRDTPSVPTRVLVTPGLHDSAFVIDFVANAVAGMEHLFDVTIKPHPKAQIVPRERAAAALRFVDATSDVYAWLGDTDVLITTYSAVGVEAIAFGVPVVVIRSRRTPDFSPLAYQGTPVETVASAEALTALLARLATDAGYRTAYLARLRGALEHSFVTTSGVAAAATAQACALLATEGRRSPASHAGPHRVEVLTARKNA